MFRYKDVILEIEYKDLPLEDSTILRGFKGSGFADAVQINNVRNTEQGLIADIESHVDLSGLYPSLTIIVEEWDCDGKIISGKIAHVYFVDGVNVDHNVLPLPVSYELRPANQWGLND